MNNYRYNYISIKIKKYFDNSSLIIIQSIIGNSFTSQHNVITYYIKHFNSYIPTLKYTD